MMDEDAARALPKMSVLELVVDQDVPFLSVVGPVHGHAGENARARKMLGGPSYLLRRSPVAAWQARQDKGIEMPHRIEQLGRVGHQRQCAVKIRMARQLAPEGPAAALLERSRRHAQKRGRGPVEIGKNAIATEIKLHR